MSEPLSDQDKELVLRIAKKLPEDGDPNQDFLFDLAQEGMTIEKLAALYASGNVSNVRSRILIQYGKLEMPIPYTDPHAMHLLRCAFDL